MLKLPLRIETGTAVDGLHVSIFDQVSGKVVLMFVLDHASVARMIMGQELKDPVNAEVLDATQVPHLGRKCHIYTRAFKVTDSDTRNMLRVNQEVPALELWADTMRSYTWSHTSSWSLRNQQRVVFTLRRYCNELTDEQDKGIQLLLDNAEPPKGLIAL